MKKTSGKGKTSRTHPVDNLYGFNGIWINTALTNSFFANAKDDARHSFETYAPIREFIPVVQALWCELKGDKVAYQCYVAMVIAELGFAAEDDSITEKVLRAFTDQIKSDIGSNEFPQKVTRAIVRAGCPRAPLPPSKTLVTTPVWDYDPSSEQGTEAR